MYVTTILFGQDSRCIKRFNNYAYTRFRIINDQTCMISTNTCLDWLIACVFVVELKLIKSYLYSSYVSAIYRILILSFRTGYYGDRIEGPTKCKVVVDGCRAKFVLKSDNKTECYTKTPLGVLSSQMPGIQEDAQAQYTETQRSQGQRIGHGYAHPAGYSHTAPGVIRSNQNTMALNRNLPSSFWQPSNQNVVQRVVQSSTQPVSNIDNLLQDYMPMLKQMITNAVNGNSNGQPLHPQGTHRSMSSSRQVYPNSYTGTQALQQNLMNMIQNRPPQTGTMVKMTSQNSLSNSENELPQLIQKVVRKTMSSALPPEHRFPSSDGATKMSLGVKTTYTKPGEYGGQAQFGAQPSTEEVVKNVPISNQQTNIQRQIIRHQTLPQPVTRQQIVQPESNEHTTQTQTIGTVKSQYIQQPPIVNQDVSQQTVQALPVVQVEAISNSCIDFVFI